MIDRIVNHILLNKNIVNFIEFIFNYPQISLCPISKDTESLIINPLCLQTTRAVFPLFLHSLFNYI